MSERIASLQNPLVKHLVKLQQDRAYRYEKQEVVIEGRKMISEAPSIKSLFAINSDNLREDCRLVLVTPEVMKKISTVESPEGAIALTEMPPFVSLEEKKALLVLDGINDPGNLGTLIRTAVSFGWDGLYLLENCCDPYNHKALRAAKGATFKIALGKGGVHSLPKNHQVLIADLDGQNPETLTLSENRILILGSEAHGVSQQCRELGEIISLPMSKMESLNVAVAGGILLYLLKP